MRFSSPPNQQAYYEQVWNLVRQIPRGKVASYGQIAMMIPIPNGIEFESYKAFSPRWVGGAMAACPDDVPWQRVINRQGRISIHDPYGGAIQRNLLEAEDTVATALVAVVAIVGTGQPVGLTIAHGHVLRERDALRVTQAGVPLVCALLPLAVVLLVVDARLDGDVAARLQKFLPEARAHGELPTRRVRSVNLCPFGQKHVARLVQAIGPELQGRFVRKHVRGDLARSGVRVKARTAEHFRQAGDRVFLPAAVAID